MTGCFTFSAKSPVVSLASGWAIFDVELGWIDGLVALFARPLTAFDAVI